VQQAIADFKQLEVMVEATIDLSLLDRHEYAVNPQFDPDLQALREQQDDVREAITNLAPKVHTHTVARVQEGGRQGN
jgi:hypothetical protein